MKTVIYLITFTIKGGKKLYRKVYAESEEDAKRYLRFHYQVKDIISIITKQEDYKLATFGRYGNRSYVYNI